MVYTLSQIENIIAPVVSRYGIRRVYLFGSYARGTAGEDSDIDLLVDTAGTQLTDLFRLGALYTELEDALQKKIDLITLNSLQQPARMPSEQRFKDTVRKERVIVYAAA